MDNEIDTLAKQDPREVTGLPVNWNEDDEEDEDEDESPCCPMDCECTCEYEYEPCEPPYSRDTDG